MPRAKNLPAAKHRRKKLLEASKGFFGMAGNVHTVAKSRIDKARQFAYRDRRVRKRDFRSLWIVRINAAARENGTTYSRLMGALAKKGITLNRKMLADIAYHHSDVFAQLVKQVK
ncbi:MAG: 50S ribosomal protein L20 [Bacteroidota bacterium]|nr:50S ribosomal protein L20 [Bacteroidota bacterium]MDP4234603.1 50S ribosomal protein L20 [Bacteroidota bacterium]MDP4243798.1 50S ribosomal protein L20 [Bacteroidota bacterium]MDP4288964.1 50S ribosomal protein L20 [Bacteroidota bacterium]